MYSVVFWDNLMTELETFLKEVRTIIFIFSGNFAGGSVSTHKHISQKISGFISIFYIS
jgi:hypothetical protein